MQFDYNFYSPFRCVRVQNKLFSMIALFVYLQHFANMDKISEKYRQFDLQIQFKNSSRD